MNDVVAVANFFIERGIQEKVPISPMKLQKLVFYAYSFYLAGTGKKLFNENIEAWEFGPVVPTIYHETKKWGNEPISHLLTVFDPVKSKGDYYYEPQLNTVDDNYKIKVLEDIWKNLKGLSAVQLSNASHASDTPWDRVRKSFGDQSIPRNTPIPDKDIIDHFKKYIIKGKNI